MDEFWLAMEELKVSSGEKLFRYLPVVALSALSLPHSTADPKRSFSMVRKIQTDQRDSLSITYTYFQFLGVLTIGDKIRLKEKCREFTSGDLKKKKT